MPFKSEKQRRFLYKEKPEVAKEFAAKENKNPLAGAKARREQSNMDT